MPRAKAKKNAKKSKAVKSARGSVKCDTCGKTFSMPAHLGRHMSAIHNIASKAKKKGAAAAKKRLGRKPGRPPAIAKRFQLSTLSLDELAALIKAAREEAGDRLQAFQAMLSQ
jgi:ribosomal protein S14